jgi:5-methyltetrahydrofolate--homocysteine methyltransferase
MIGGATTSPVHTALRIEPNYSKGVFWVKDASRAVGIARRLTNPEQRAALTLEYRENYAELRERRAQGSRRAPPVALEAARSNKVAIEWDGYEPPAPSRPGITVFDDYPLAELIDYIDWTPFFQTWEMSGRYPDILDDPDKGEAARSLFEDARRMLDRIVAEKWLRARATVGLFPAASQGDDVVVYASPGREQELERLCFLRQQKPKASGQPNFCLADFVAPEDSGWQDHVGLFAVTAGLGIEERVTAFETDNDDYSSILLKALADRLAEALAERMHQRVRKEIWAYAPDEALDPAELIAEQYQGIRPAPGYPACPDHSEKKKLFALLDAGAGSEMQLTSGYAMLPAASVSGYYFSHPQSQYFVLGTILGDQLADYARRKGISEDEARRNLVANID